MANFFSFFLQFLTNRNTVLYNRFLFRLNLNYKKSANKNRFLVLIEKQRPFWPIKIGRKMHNYKNKTMKNSILKTTPLLSKFIILFSFLLIAFTVGDSRSEYIVPAGSVSVFGADLDLDNDIDIVVGSNYCPITQWGGGILDKR